MNKPLEIFGRGMMDKKAPFTQNMYNRGGPMCPPAKTTMQGKLHADANIFGYRAGTQAYPYNAIGATLCGRP